MLRIRLVQALFYELMDLYAYMQAVAYADAHTNTYS